jgi:hypothetical protein
MAIDAIVAAPPPAANSIAVTEATSADERWAAWQAKGAAHDRAVRRKTGFVVPILMVAVAVVLYTLLGR